MSDKEQLSAYITQLEEALARRPTPGPWTAVNYGVDGETHYFLDTSKAKADIAAVHGEGTVSPNYWDPVRQEADMKYIAACHPEAIRALLDELHRMRLELHPRPRRRRAVSLRARWRAAQWVYGLHWSLGYMRIYCLYKAFRTLIKRPYFDQRMWKRGIKGNHEVKS